MKITEKILPHEFDDAQHIGCFRDGRAYIARGGKHNAIDTDGRLVLPRWYPMISRGVANCTASYSDTMICLLSDDGKFGYADTDGEIVIPFRFDWAGYFADGLSCVMLDGKYGLIDKRGDFVIPPMYDSLGRWSGEFCEGKLFACLEGKWGFIDRENRAVLPFVYDAPPKRMFLSRFSDGLAPVRQGDRLFFIDHEGKEVLPIPENCLCTGGFDGGFAYMHFSRSPDDCVTGLMRRDGSWLVPPICRYIGPLRAGLMRMERDGKTAFINTDGETVLDADYAYVYDFAGGRAWVRKEDKWGAIDTAGSVAVPFTLPYVYVDPSWDGSGLCVGNGEKYGYADRDGSLVLPLAYEKEIRWCEGHAVTKKDGQWVILHFGEED